MVEINQEILEKYGIYKTRELKQNEEKKLIEIKHKIEKLINITIERLYVIDESAWGKDAENQKYTICILIEKRYKELNPLKNILKEFCKINNIVILLWTLCQYEKRKDIPTEKEYYIERYGIKAYDSGKFTEINEKIETTEYAEKMNSYKAVRSYISDNPDFIMNEVVRIYTLKIGYAVIGKTANLERDCEFAKLVTKDQMVIEMIDNYLQQSEEIEKKKIAIKFEKYVKKAKQVKFTAKLQEKPTMKIYEKLLKRKNTYGSLDIKTLTRDELYIMYVIQRIGASKIAKLYDVKKQIIDSKRDNWNIKLSSTIFMDNEKLMIECIEIAKKQNEKYAYVFLKKIGMMNFEKIALPILEYISDDNIYLLKEFWQFAEERENGIFESCILDDKKYKVGMCIDLLLQNELVEEVDYKQYKINKKGKELIEYCSRNNLNEITIPIIYKYFNNVKYYNLFYTDGYPAVLENFELKSYDDFKKKIEAQTNKNFIAVDEKKAIENDNIHKKESIVKENISIEKQILNLELIDYENVKQEKNQKLKKKSSRIVKINFSKINEAKIDFGKKCEEMIYLYEIERLKKEGREDKAKDVVWISRDSGDGAGYDIESFEKKDGKYEKIYIEVKGTDKKVTEPFEVTINEVIVSEKYKENYYIYRIGKASTEKPLFYKINGSIREKFELEAIKFKAIKRSKMH